MIGGIKLYKKNQNWVTFNPNSAEYLFFAPFETIYYTVQTAKEGRGVKIPGKTSDVINERPLRLNLENWPL